MIDDDYRSRLFLIVRAGEHMPSTDAVAAALSGGDVGCLLIEGLSADDADSMRELQPTIEDAQARDVAVVIADDVRAVSRLSADGLHIGNPNLVSDDDLKQWRKRELIVGTAGIANRHQAMHQGERGFDYVFFGRTDKDQTGENHTKTAELAAWWSEIMEIPCVAIAGHSDEAVLELAAAGVEFIAVGDQIWTSSDPAVTVRDLNRLLESVARAGAAA